MKINKISRKLIKPHTPTPQNLKNYRISIIDQFMGSLNIAVILFYKSKPENTNQLQESLAKTLVQFYPLAGRYIKNDHIVDCSDKGAELVEAEAPDAELITCITKIETNQLNSLLPEPYFRVDEAADDPLLSIQITHFSCGGLAIAISVSHRVFDVSSLGTFVSAWSDATSPDQTARITPTFDIPSLLPYKDLGVGVGVAVGSGQFSTKDADEIFFRRFLFDKGTLTSLRSKIRVTEGKTVSGVHVVCAVIAKALIGLDRAKHGKSRDFVVGQAVNMRERTIPPQPKHACGNFAVSALTRRVAATEAEEIELRELVDLIGVSVRESICDHAEILCPDRDGRDIVADGFGNFIREVLNPETNVMVFTDWSKFGFYEADFGSGKPVWISIGPQRPPYTSFTVLMSDKEGEGIEAWVLLNQNDFHYLGDLFPTINIPHL